MTTIAIEGMKRCDRHESGYWYRVDHAGCPRCEAENPEVRIETMIAELAYERVKHSCLFDLLASNAAIDAKASELADKVTELVEAWIMDEVNAAADADNRKEQRA